MTHRTAVRRSTVVGMGLLGAVALAGTAQAQALPAPGTTLATVTGTTAQVVDPLTTPLNQAVTGVVGQTDPVTQPAPAPVQQAVQQATSTLTGTAPTSGDGPTQTPGPGTTTTTPPVQDAAPAGGGQQGTTSQTGQQAGQQQTAQQQAAQQQAGTAGGHGVAAVPDSLVRKLNSLEQFSPGAGFANASNPMSLFGAPQVAPLAPAVTAELLPTPLAVRPAGGALEQALPVGAAQDLPAVLVAIAFTAVAGAGAAQVAVLRTRRSAAVPA